MSNPFERAVKIPETEPGSSNGGSERTLTTKNKNEVMDMFRLTRQLFDFAEKNLDEHAGFIYADTNNEYSDNPYAKELPENFYPIIADYPGIYFVVSYENRLDDCFAEGTRMQQVRLSSVPKKSLTNERIREIGITEYAPSEGKGNMQFLTVTDSVMEKGFADINTAGEGEVDAPHGSAKLTYEVNPVGEKKIVSSKFNRMDEGIFEWDNAQAPVRWVRNLEIDRQSSDDMKALYKDLYIIGRDNQGDAKKAIEVQVNIEVKGNIGNPSSLQVSFGFYRTGGETLYEDNESGIKVIMGDTGRTTPEEVINILKNDPNYSFIFEGQIDKEKMSSLLRQKMSMISSDWDKKTAVFGTNLLEGEERVPELDY